MEATVRLLYDGSYLRFLYSIEKNVNAIDVHHSRVTEELGTTDVTFRTTWCVLEDMPTGLKSRKLWDRVKEYACGLQVECQHHNRKKIDSGKCLDIFMKDHETPAYLLASLKLNRCLKMLKMFSIPCIWVKEGNITVLYPPIANKEWLKLIMKVKKSKGN